MRRVWLFAALSVCAAAAFAHSGVQNPAVMARMHLMSSIAEATKVLGQMASGKTAFDTNRAAQAQAQLRTLSGDVAAAFAAPETDPKSEALPRIWSEPPAFAAEVAEMQDVIAALDVRDPASLQAGVAALSQSCRSCHRGFRK